MLIELDLFRKETVVIFKFERQIIDWKMCQHGKDSYHYFFHI